MGVPCSGGNVSAWASSLRLLRFAVQHQRQRDADQARRHQQFEIVEEGNGLRLVRDGSDQVADLTVWSDTLFTVTVNLYPYNPGHVMLFPNRHVDDVRDFTDAEERALSQLTRKTLDILDLVSMHETRIEPHQKASVGHRNRDAEGNGLPAGSHLNRNSGLHKTSSLPVSERCL